MLLLDREFSSIGHIGKMQTKFLLVPLHPYDRIAVLALEYQHVVSDSTLHLILDSHICDFLDANVRQ